MPFNISGSLRGLIEKSEHNSRPKSHRVLRNQCPMRFMKIKQGYDSVRIGEIPSKKVTNF